MSATPTELVNLFQNPSFEAAGSQNVIIRTNLANDPAATAARLSGQLGWAARWYGSGGSGTTSYISGAVDGPLPSISTYIHKAWAVGAAPGDTGFQNMDGDNTSSPVTIGFPVSPGDTFTFSAYLRAIWSLTGTRSANFTVYWRDSSGNFISAPAGPQVPLTNGLWARVSFTATAPAGAALFGLNIDADVGPNWAAGDTLDGTGLLVEKTSDLRDYFDQNTSSVIVRTNYVTYPDASAWAVNATDSGFDNNRYTGDESYSLLTGLTVPPTALTTAARITWKTTAASGRGFNLSGNPDGSPSSAIPVQAGVPITVSLYVRPSTGTMAQQIRYLFSDHLNQALGSELFSAVTTPAAGVWTRIWVTVTPPVGASYISLGLTLDGGSASVAAGDTLDATGLLVETGQLQNYFDGNSHPLDQTVYEWLNQPGFGMSQARTTTDFSYLRTGAVPLIQMVASPSALVDQGTACAAIMSQRWRSSGSWSLRLLPTVSGNPNSSSGNIAGDWIQSGDMLPGQTYTVLASFYQPAPQAGTLAANARSIVVSYVSSGQTVVTTAQAQNISGTQQLRLKVTLPVLTTSATISLTNGASYGNGDVWWDDMLVVEGDYDGDFFDGDTPSTADWQYTWSVGEVNYGLATSIATPPSNTGLELTVYKATDPTTAIDILARATDISTLEEIPTGNGAGSFSILSTDPVFQDNPTICDYRNVVKLSCNGKVVGAFVIQNESATQLDTNDGQDIQNSYTGEGLRTWFNDAVVYPETGLTATASDDRYFNFAAHLGDWLDTSIWTTPVVNAYYHATGPATYAAPWDGSPTDWPTQASSAKWVWNAAFSRTATPIGDVYFRREFDTTAASSSIDLYVTADDYFSVYLDSQLVSATDTTSGNYHNTYKVTVQLPPGHHVLGIKASNVGGPASLLAAMFYSPDAASGTFGSLILQTGDTGWICRGYPFFPPGWTVGAVLLQLLSEAQSRGVLFPSFLTPTFTSAVDSYRNLWRSQYELNFSVGSSYADVVAQLESLGYEVWIDPDTFELNAAPKRGATRGDTISIEAGLNLISSDGSAQADITNALAMKSNDGWSETTAPDSIVKYGRIEGSSSISGSMVQGSDLAATLMTAKSNPETGASYGFTPSPGCIPNVDFFVGDYVLAPDILTGQMVSRRVVSITTTQDDAGNPVYVLEFDIVFQEIEQRLASQLSQISNGTITTAGSTSGTNPFGSGVATATIAPGSGSNSQVGTVTSPAGGYATVTFPAGLFSSTPTVLVQPISQPGGMVVVPWFGAQPSVNGFSVGAWTISNPTNVAATFQYYAFE